MKKITLIILLLILIPTIYAKEGSMKLLAVSENNNKSGSIANLHLEITEGDGRVFIDSFPLTKVDTQISTRFAKEIACHLSIVDCSNYNFFYNIRANSPIVGGPSAGAAISILTLSVLEDLNVNEKASITGTINSGGLIGPVGGIEGKINAAAKNNLTKVLIPKWSNINDTNLSELSNINGIEIIQVSDLKEAIFEMTGKKYENNKKIIVNSFYVDTMNDISSKLCEDTSKLVYDKNTSIIKDANELYDKGKKSIEINEFYSAASYCFGANVKFRYERYIDQNLNNQKIIRLVNDVFNRTK